MFVSRPLVSEVRMQRMAIRALACAAVLGGLTAMGVVGAERADASGPTPTAKYLFQNTLNSSVSGAPALTNLGPGTNAFVTDSVNGTAQTVLSYPKDNGVSLSPTTGVVSNSIYTIAALVRVDDVTGYRRLVDFKNGTADSGLYDYYGQLYFYPNAVGSSSPAPMVDGEYTMVVVTRDNTGLVTGYVDGVQQLSFDDSTSQNAVIDSNNTLRFFRDNDTGGASGEDSSGAVSRIELFNSALTATQVAALTPGSSPNVHVTPNSGVQGTGVVASGGGFKAGETVKVSYKTGLTQPNPKKVAVCTATASNVGTFSCTGAIPTGTTAGSSGSHKIAAKGSTSGSKASATYTLT
jgi:hypothetical protein